MTRFSLSKFLLLVLAFCLMAGRAGAQSYSDNFDTDTSGANAPGWANLSIQTTANYLVGATGAVSPAKALSGGAVDGAIDLYTAFKPPADYCKQYTVIWGTNTMGSIMRSSDTSFTTGYLVLQTDVSTLRFYKDSAAGTFALLQGVTTSYPWAIGDQVIVKTQVTGSNPTVLSFKEWKVGTAEPGAYQYSYSDSTAPITAAGYDGLRVTNTTGAVVTADDYYFGPANTTFGSVSILPTDANIIRSPYTWNGGTTINAGAYLSGSFVFTATGSLALSLNTTGWPATGTSRPALTWSIDNGARQDAQLTDAAMVGTSPAQSLTLATGLTAGTHSLYLRYKADDPYANTWTLGEPITISGFSAPIGTTMAAQSAPSAYAIFFGDSITVGEGQFGLNGAGNYVAFTDTGYAYPAQVAKALDLGYGVAAFGGAGWANTSAGAQPVFGSAWNLLSSGISRVFTPAPAYAFVNMGTNGGGSTGAAGTVSAQMTAMRAAVGAACKDIYLVPFGQFAKSGLLSELSTYGGGYTTRTIGTATVYRANSDANTYLVDLGAAFSAGLTNAGGSSLQSFDTVHPTAIVQGQAAAKIVGIVQAIIATGGTKRRIQ